MSLAILSLDLAQATGWARLDREGRLTSGVERFGLEEPAGVRYQRFRRFVRGLALEEGASITSVSGSVSVERTALVPAVDWIVWERVVSYGGGTHAMVALYGLEAHLVHVAHRARVETRTVNPATLKKHACGNGRASKDDMMQAAIDRWGSQLDGRAPRDHNESDALLALAWGLEHAPLWEVAP